MKPTFQINQNRTINDSLVPRRLGSISSRVDYNFQSTTADFGRCHGHGAPSFRALSSDYFANEARAHFAMEAFVFGVMIVTAAVPVIAGLRGLFQFVYGVL